MLKKEDIQKIKSKGFLLNRKTENFSGRILAPGTVFTAENFRDMSYIAENFGNGKLICTSRQAVEIPGIPFAKIDDVLEYAALHNLTFGGTGNKIRPITSCKGTTCIYGSYDTQALASKIHDRFYIGWGQIPLPHKFKIAVGGCPNSCIKPSLNDFGIEGRRVPSNNGEPLYQIYVGGTWGKNTKIGKPLNKLISKDEILPVLEKSLLWFKKYAYAKERFGIAIERIGFENFESEIFAETLMQNKDEIISADILERK